MDTYRILNAPELTSLTYQSLEQAFNRYKENVIDQINDKYVSQVSYVDQIHKIRLENNRLTGIALYFQILGLLFVLSRGVV